jgi:hypothetical protein
MPPVAPPTLATRQQEDQRWQMTNRTTKCRSIHTHNVVTWDSDTSSSDDDDSDNDRTTKKKALASITINEKPSLFDTPSYFIAKATTVQTCDDGYDSKHDNEPTKDELLDMLDDAKEHFDIKRRECKDL